MAKRMTSTDIWQKEWFMQLEPRLKCLVRFIWDNCDNSGVWSPNWTLASMMIGQAVCLDDIKQIDGGRRHFIMSNGKIWIEDFVEFQCGQHLNAKSPPHKKVIDLLKIHGLTHRLRNRVRHTLQEGEEEKEADQEKEKEKAADQKEEVVLPWQSESFAQLWQQWKAYKRTEFKFKYASIQSEQAALTKLSNMASDEAEASEIIMNAMANGWKGHFPLDKKTKSEQSNKAQSTAASIIEARGL